MYMNSKWSITSELLVLSLVSLGILNTCCGQTSNDTFWIFKDKLGSDVYNTQVRPAANQSVPTRVNVTFSLLSIVDVDDVRQQFHCNGFLQMAWVDELVQWNPANYGGQVRIHPMPKEIWRPRVVLQNTLDDRDIFEDDHAPLITFYDGKTYYFPGSLFSSSCDLDMTYYPYDKQTCSVGLLSMGWDVTEVDFQPAHTQVFTNFYSPHDEWDLMEARVAYTAMNDDVNDFTMPGILITFKVQRRASFLLLNIILPVVFLSLMNLLVFAIPEESGEKLSYGITVLLALTVYLSIISSMLPRSSDKLPLVNKYIFILLIISLLTVIDSIVIVFLSYMEQKEEVLLRAKENFRHAFTKVTNVRKAVQPFDINTLGMDPSNKLRLGSAPIPSPDYQSRRESTHSCKARRPALNKYKLIGKHINIISLVVFSLVWTTVTLGFMVTIATSG